MLPRSLSVGLAAFGFFCAPALVCGDELFFQSYLKRGEEPVVFAVTGDLGDGLWNPNPALVASMIKGWEPDFFVGTGDLNYGSTAVGSPDWDRRVGSRYGDMMLGRADGRYPLQTSKTQRFYPVLGNHDTSVGGLGGEGDIKGYIDYFVKNAPGHPDRVPLGQGEHNDLVSYYDFTIGDMLFVVANSDRGRLDKEIAFREAQNAWIGSVLEGSDARFKFVFMHHPPYSSASPHLSSVHMQGDHLREADVVFSAHAHVYERLLVDGVNYITCGLGGRRPYWFVEERQLPESVFRYPRPIDPVGDIYGGAMHVMRSGDGVRVGFVHLLHGVIDGIFLGDFEFVRNEQEHLVELLAGQQLTVATSTVGPANLLDPMVEVTGPGGVVLGSATGGGLDGKNVSATFDVTRSGRYRVKVRPEGDDGGNYQLTVIRTPDPPGSPIEIWRAQRFGAGVGDAAAGNFADPDWDGVINLLEYALGRDPVANAETPVGAGVMMPLEARGMFAAEIEMKEGLRSDLSYVLHARDDVVGGVWQQVAIKEPGRYWSGVVQVVEYPGEGDSVVFRVVDYLTGARLYRLGVVVN